MGCDEWVSGCDVHGFKIVCDYSNEPWLLNIYESHGWLKGGFTPKMKIHSFCTNQYADGKGGWRVWVH